MWKNYLYSLLYILAGIIIFSLIINILYYFDVIGSNLAKYLKFIGIGLPSLIGGLSIGIKSDSKGYMSGIKLSLMFILVLFIFSLIFKGISLKSIFYYLIVSIIIVLGSMIGINKKKQ